MARYSWPLPGEGVTAEELLMAEIRAALPGVNSYSSQARRDAMLAEIVAALYNGGGFSGLSRTLYQNAGLSTTSAVEGSITSFALPAGTLVTTGQALRITVNGRVVGGTGATLKVKFGADTSAIALTTGDTFIVSDYTARTGAATQFRTVINWHGTSVGATITNTPTETLANAITVDFRGNVTTTGTLFLDSLLVEFITS